LFLQLIINADAEYVCEACGECYGPHLQQEDQGFWQDVYSERTFVDVSEQPTIDRQHSQEEKPPSKGYVRNIYARGVLLRLNGVDGGSKRVCLPKEKTNALFQDVWQSTDPLAQRAYICEQLWAYGLAGHRRYASFYLKRCYQQRGVPLKNFFLSQEECESLHTMFEQVDTCYQTHRAKYEKPDKTQKSKVVGIIFVYKKLAELAGHKFFSKMLQDPSNLNSLKRHLEFWETTCLIMGLPFIPHAFFTD
jgi:hypothetical protein